MKKKLLKTYLELHLLELKYNLFILSVGMFYLFTVSYYFSDQLIYLLVNNLLNKNMLKYFIFTNITEIFITNIFIAIFISVFLSLPLVLLLICFFLSKGLYKYENFFFLKFYILCIVFNFLIIKLIFIQIIPHIWSFLLDLNFSNLYIFPIYFEPKINKYFDFIFSSFIYIFLIFNYFFIFFFSIFFNILKINIVTTFRKFFHLKILLVSALITPPDILNFLGLYILLLFLFEIIIYFLIFVNKYKLSYFF